MALNTYQDLAKRYQQMFGMGRGAVAWPHYGGRVAPYDPEADLNRVSRENAMSDLGSTTGSGRYGDALGKIFGTNPEIGAQLFQALYGQEAAGDLAHEQMGQQANQNAIAALLGMEKIKSQDFGAMMGSKVASSNANAQIAQSKREGDLSRWLMGEQNKEARLDKRIQGDITAAGVKAQTQQEIQQQQDAEKAARQQEEIEKALNIAFVKQMSDWDKNIWPTRKTKVVQSFNEALQGQYPGFPALTQEQAYVLAKARAEQEKRASLRGQDAPVYILEEAIKKYYPDLVQHLSQQQPKKKGFWSSLGLGSGGEEMAGNPGYTL